MVIKGVFLLVLIVLLINPLTYANVTPYGSGGGSGNLEVSRPDEKSSEERIFFRVGDQGYFKNKAPQTNLNYPTDRRVVSGNLVEFNWKYSDNENDEQINYNLEIDGDPRMISPLSFYGLNENTKKIYLVDGNKLLYWRVRSKDSFGWGEFSPVEEFYLDLTRKICEDGTPYFQCSLISFKYCDNGQLKEVCSLCGCEEGKECKSDGTCTEIITSRPLENQKIAKKNLFNSFLDFFKIIF